LDPHVVDGDVRLVTQVPGVAGAVDAGVEVAEPGEATERGPAGAALQRPSGVGVLHRGRNHELGEPRAGTDDGDTLLVDGELLRHRVLASWQVHAGPGAGGVHPDLVQRGLDRVLGEAGRHGVVRRIRVRHRRGLLQLHEVDGVLRAVRRVLLQLEHAALRVRLGQYEAGFVVDVPRSGARRVARAGLGAVEPGEVRRQAQRLHQGAVDVEVQRRG